MDIRFMSGHKSKIEKDGFICPDTGHKSKLKKMDFICPLCKCERSHVRTYVQVYVPDKIRILIKSGHKSKSQSGRKSKC